MAKVKILEEKGTGEQIIPVTKAKAVFLGDGTDTVEGILPPVADKMGDTDTELETTAKTVVGAINELYGNLTPTSLSRPPIHQNRVSNVAGGFMKAGRIVVVDMQMTAELSSYSGGTIFTGFPASFGTNSISAYVLDGSNQIPMGAHVSSSGNMTITSPSGVSMKGKDMYIAGTYIAN